MPIDINGSVIQTSNAAIQIITNSVLGLDTSSLGFMIQPTRPFFVAIDNYAGWHAYPSNDWVTMIFNQNLYDNTNSYNNVNGRFTAPVTGSYHFQASTYSYKGSSDQSSYVHPIFRVNDSYTLKQASQTTPYRLRLRTWYAGGYTGDTQINEILYLKAGDYVNLHHYSSQQNYWYGTQSFFSGFFIG